MKNIVSHTGLISTFYAIVSMLALLGVIQVGQVENSLLSIVYVMIQCLGICVIWQVSGKKLGIFIMFQLTFCLFIGGRFFAYLLNPNLDIEIFEPTFFFDYTVSSERKIEIYSYVLLFVIFSILGYSSVRKRNGIKPLLNLSVGQTAVKNISKIGNILFPIFCICTIYSSLGMLVKAVSGGGYLVLYAGQSNEYAAGGSFIPNLILFFFSFAFVYGNESLRRNYLILYLFNSIINLMIGTRGGIGALFLFVIWLYSLRHKINLVKLGLVILGALVLLLYLFSFSVRADEEGAGPFSLKTLMDAISIFLYTNGISLMVFDASRLIDTYPSVAYLQTFVPGATWLWGLMGNSLQPQDFSFSYHMCYELNPSLFVSGSGLGWTILSDIYLFSFRCMPIFMLLSFIVGRLLGMLEVFSEKYRFYKYLTFYIFMTCMLIPRGGGLIPLLIYGVFYLFLFQLIFSKKKNYG